MKALRSLDALVREGLVTADPRLDAIARTLAIAITPEMAAAIDRSDMARDPIARQFVPSLAEAEIAADELADPIGDEARSPVKGIVHRYPDRVLLKPIHVCPVYCRFCFRREMVGPEGMGTMSPAALVRILKPARAALWLAVHCNHARELGPGTKAALTRLADSGIPLIGQTVLLKGVNDDVATLETLMRALVASRVKPYYLHHPDLVRGTGHFRVTIEHGQALMKALRGRLSGLAQPTYVLDVPGGHGKVPIGPGYLGDDPDALTIEDAFGSRHRYPG